MAIDLKKSGAYTFTRQMHIKYLYGSTLHKPDWTALSFCENIPKLVISLKNCILRLSVSGIILFPRLFFVFKLIL